MSHDRCVGDKYRTGRASIFITERRAYSIDASKLSSSEVEVNANRSGIKLMRSQSPKYKQFAIGTSLLWYQLGPLLTMSCDPFRGEPIQPITLL